MKIIFLDRDGVINRYPGDKNYVTRVKDFAFLPGALTALKNLTKEKYRIFIISNQAGVGKGTYSQAALDAITDLMLKKVNKGGAEISGVFYCTHRADANCSCRKPKLGLIRKALKKIRFKSAKATYFVGDSIMDVQTGKNSGFKTILVLSGKEKLKNQNNWEAQPDFIAKDLLAATKIVLNENSGYLCHSRCRPQKVR